MKQFFYKFLGNCLEGYLDFHGKKLECDIASSIQGLHNSA